MSTNYTTIRPGLLIGLKTTINGGVSYTKIDLEAARIDTATGVERARWETTRVVSDADEHKRAVEVRGRVRTTILRECFATAFGYVCPATNEKALRAAVMEARSLAASFNRDAKHSVVQVNVLIGRIAANDQEAAKAIADETRELVEAMTQAIEQADVATIRDAANRARRVASMLSDETQGKVSAAIEQARKAARELVRRVEKSGEQAAAVIAELSTEALTSARFALLDIDAPEGAEAVAPPAPAPALDLEVGGEVQGTSETCSTPAPDAPAEATPSAAPAAEVAPVAAERSESSESSGDALPWDDEDIADEVDAANARLRGLAQQRVRDIEL